MVHPEQTFTWCKEFSGDGWVTKTECDLHIVVGIFGIVLSEFRVELFYVCSMKMAVVFSAQFESFTLTKTDWQAKNGSNFKLLAYLR